MQNYTAPAPQHELHRTHQETICTLKRSTVYHDVEIEDLSYVSTDKKVEEGDSAHLQPYDTNTTSYKQWHYEGREMGLGSG